MKKICYLLPFLIFHFYFSSNLIAQAGMLDSTFGGTGIVTSSPGAHSTSVAVQSDSKVVTAGYDVQSNSFIVARYKQNGVLDRSFGEKGTVDIHLDTLKELTSVALQDDGKILIAGTAGKSIYLAFTIIRLNSNGTIDNSFGINGIVQASVNYSNSEAKCVSVLKNGKILISGDAHNGWIYPDFTVARFNSNGSIDSSFNNYGFVQTNIGGTELWGTIDHVYGHVVQSDNKILVVGSNSMAGGSPSFAIVRYNENGVLDSSFGDNGKILAIPGIGTSIAIFKNKIIVAGIEYNEKSNWDFKLLRYKMNGSLDTKFGTNGEVVIDFNAGPDYANVISLQQDDKIVIAGAAWNNATNYDFAIVRMNIDGSLDSTFGNGGKVITKPTNNYSLEEATSLAIDNHRKKIIITGSGNGSFITLRYNATDVTRGITTLSTVDTDISSVKVEREVLNIYPNPVSNFLTITGLDKKLLSHISVLSEDGKILQSKKVYASSTKINLNNFSKGAYYLLIEVNEKKYYEKILKL